MAKAAPKKKQSADPSVTDAAWPEELIPVQETPWLRAPWQRFLAMQQQGRLPHGLLITGARSLGTLSLARSIMAYLLCSDPIAMPGKESACGVCSACRLRLAGTHPDIHLLTRTGVSQTASAQGVSVDEIRTLIETFSFTRYGPLRIAFIEQAERMNRNAANSLLKLLEEPPPGSLFLMTAERADLLPSTIRSRVQRLSVTMPSRSALLGWLCDTQGVAKTDAELLWFMNDEQLMRGQLPTWDWQAATAALVELMADDGAVLTTVQCWQGIERDTLARWLLRLWVDVMRLHSGLQSEAPVTLAPLIRRLAQHDSGEHWLKLHRVLLEFLQTATHPLNDELALARLALDLIDPTLPHRLA
ncbi:MAG: hypothetical protein ACYC3A_00625 [Halothiobacillus sp.]